METTHPPEYVCAVCGFRTFCDFERCPACEPTKTKEPAAEVRGVVGEKMPWRSLQRAPFRCPICNGKGIVPNGFYSSAEGYGTTTDATPETCRTCNGEGIVWG